MEPGRVVVIGLGRTGAAVARAFSAEGRAVLVVDRADDSRVRERAATLPAGVDVMLGGYPEDVAAGAALVCPSPGVAWDAAVLRFAREHGIPVHSEMELVFERCHGRVVGITGTNGKTTTSSLVAAILEQSGNRVHLGGNIGVPMLDRLDSVQEGDWVVLELSSFQLETVAEPRCAIACVLNVTPDHLDRHHSLEAYAETKRRIVRFAIDDAVLGFDDPITREMAAASQARVRYFGADIGGHDGATLRDADVVSVESGGPLRVLPVAEIPLFGDHNVLNVLAAVAISRAAGVDSSVIAAGVRAFQPVPHRLQTVSRRDGVLWINDSKATNTESAAVALRSFGDRPIVWIGGGQAMDTPMDALVDEVVARARFAILNGATGADLDRALHARGFSARRLVTGLRDAISVAREVARPGDVVLFAPGFKSFDQFHDFEERGDVFAGAVREGPG